MARRKATITLDAVKAEEARALVGGRSISDVVDLALDRLVRSERLRRDVIAYRGQPLGEDELWVADLPVELDLDDQDLDYEKDYGTGR